jgi:curved DNA-binding protein CbpA
MSSATHYTTLSLVPTAAPEVIRAAYKALALICHPDKTMHMAAGERASHAAVFKDVQAAYDVLGNPSLKAAYDAELERNADKGNFPYSTFHHHSISRTPSDASTTKRRLSVKMTTPAEKTAMRAEAREQLHYLHQKRTERDVADAHIDDAGLKDMVNTWKHLAEENKLDPVMHAHCAIRVHEYEQKVSEREKQHKEWLVNMSTATSAANAKQGPATANASKKPAASASSAAPHRSNTSASHTAPVRGSARAEARKRDEAERTAATAAAARAEARQAEKAQREAAKQAHLDSKAAAVRADKEKQKAKTALLAQKDAERIAKARAKAGAAPLGTVGAVVDPNPNDETQASPSVVDNTAAAKAQAPVQRLCGKCGNEHASVREWMKCNVPAKQAGDGNSQASLQSV